MKGEGEGEGPEGAGEGEGEGEGKGEGEGAEEGQGEGEGEREGKGEGEIIHAHVVSHISLHRLLQAQYTDHAYHVYMYCETKLPKVSLCNKSEMNHMWKWKRLQTCRIQPLVHNQLQYKIYKRRFNTILSTFPQRVLKLQ